jgi:hypothetical protein
MNHVEVPFIHVVMYHNLLRITMTDVLLCRILVM